MSFLIMAPKEAEAIKIYQVETACFPAEEAASLEAIQHRIRNFKDTFFVLKEDDTIVGLINGCRSSRNRIADEMFLPTCKNDNRGDYVLIFSLAVAPSNQGKDYGRKLMEHLISISKDKGVQEMILTCKDKYLPYYESMGYINEGISESTHGGAVWYDMTLSLA